MGKLKYLSKNIALFSISNFVSKILVFLLVPFYTNVLTTYEYGIADVIQVTLLLLVPMVTVNIGEAALRFGIEEVDNREGIFKVGIKYVIRAATIVAILCCIARAAIDVISKNVSFSVSTEEIKWYLLLFIVLFATNAVYEFLVLYYQGCESVETIVIGSVTCTAATIGFNLIFLLGLRIGLNGYLYSQMLAYAIAAFVMISVSKRFVNTESIIKSSVNNTEAEQEVVNTVTNSETSNQDTIAGQGNTSDNLEQRMLEYSRPMVVYSTASWVNNAVDRYFVLYMCGAAVNGVYGVAYKIPAILMVFQRIFAQAWQLSATKVHKDEDSGIFYTDMYKVYNSFMVLGCAALVLLVKPVATFLFRKDFYEAWKLVPPLLISVIFGALTGFLGSICLAHKDSKSMGRATGIGALVNVVLNAVMIPHLSAMGAAIATGISYFTMGTLALIFVRKHVKIDVKIIRNIVSYVLLVAESVIMINEMPFHYVICAVIFVVLILIYLKDFITIVNVLLEKIKHRG